jgi:uncharacterized membrane protein
LQRIFETPVKRFGFALFGINVVVIVAIFVGTVSYIFEGVNDYYKFFKYEDGTNVKVAQIFERKDPILFYETLDGNDYIRKSHLGDYLAINWINTNVKGLPIIAEAVGDAYTYFARVTTNTGLVTPMGWPTHEWQWRDDTTEIYKRKDDIQLLYTTSNINDLMTVVNKYKIEYIFVGEKEREYPALNEKLFINYFQKVYSNETTTIYKVV